jgi:hypothetical protein
MRSVIFTLAILFSFYLKAQMSYQWAYNVGSTVMEYGQAIAVDPSGNVYVAGTFSGTVDFDPGPTINALTGFSGSADIFLAKYSSSGAYIWAKQIGGTNTEKAYDLVADATGAWLAGNFMGTCDFDPSASTSNTVSLGGGTDGDGFFAKYDANGAFQWGVRLGSTANDRCIGIAIDASQNAYVTGFIGFNTDFDPSASSFSLNVSGTYNAYFAKYTSAGSLTFAKQITGGYSEGDDIALDGSGNILLTGSYATTNDFDPSASTANLSTSSLTQLDIFLAKYDPLGNYTFAKQIGGIGVDIGFQVRPDASGNIYLGGVFSSTCDFDPTATVSSLTSAGQGDLFVAKYTSTGNLTWVNGTGGTQNDYCYGLGVDGSSNVYITGRFQGTNIDFDPSASTNSLTGTTFCPYVAGYNSTGGFLFANSPGDIAGEGRHLVYSAPSVYITGFFSTTGDFDFSASTANITSAGSSDIYYAKYNVCTGSPPAQPSAISGTNTMCFGTSKSYSVVNDPTATGYVWSFPSGWTGSSSVNSIVATAGTTGTISVAASNSCGISPYSTLNVTVNPLPTPTFTNTGPVCSGSSLVIGANGAVTYTIIGPNAFMVVAQSYTFASATPPVAGIYTVIVTSAAGCTAIATTTVVINTPPTQPLAISGPSVLCIGNNASYSIAPVAGASSYSWNLPGGWSGTSITNIINTTAGSSGNISVAAVNGCGAGPAMTKSVSVGGFTGSSTTQTNVTCFSACNGSAVVSVVGGSPPFTYSWTSSQTTATLSNVCAGSYTVIVTDSYGCPIQVVVNITQPPQLVINTTAIAHNKCFGNTTGSINTIATGGVPGYTYSWASSSSITPGPGPSATNLPAGSYTLTVIDASSCMTNSVYAITQPATLTAASISTAGACSSPNGSATVIFGGGTGPYTYTWTAPLSQTTNSVTGLSSGNYTITCTDANTCIASQSISIPSGGNPTVTATQSSTLICAGQTLTLTASGANTYSWNPSNSGSSIVVSPSVNATYSVTGTTTAGCTGTTALSVSVNPAPNLIVSTSNSVICNGQTAILTASGANSYTWSTSSNSNSIIVSPSVTTSYTLSGTTALGCTGSTVVTQNVSPCSGITNFSATNGIEIYPNPFTNELIVRLTKESEVDIVNSLGQKVASYKLSTGETKLNTEALSKGIYFMRIGNSKPLKLVKE